MCLCWGIEKMIVTSKTNKYVAYSLSKQTDLDRYLVKECYVEGEPKGILQSDLLCKLRAEFLRSGGRVCQKCLGVAVHECDGEHQRLLGFGGLRG